MVGISSVKAMWHWKPFLIKALISRNVEQNVMNKLWKVYVTKIEYEMISV